MALAFRNFANIVQKITVYETKETLYVLGSDEAENVFRLLEINRNDRKELMIHEVQKEYTAKETKEYFHKVQQNDKRKYSSKSSFNKIASGHALAGFVRFMEGYYLILVTQRVKVAKIGSHVIYRVQGTNMIYIPGNSATHPDESRYLKLFESVDLSNNFYFSYTYDLTHTLQYNQIQMEETSLPNFSAEQGKIEGRQQPLEQFVWNDYLIQPMKSQVHNDWILYFVHGFLSQLNMIVFGQQIYITLISRRSNKYAGTRFLKRGCNSKGYVANEVETEQIVHDASQTSFNGGAYTSFVQMRGSIPLYWSQDLTKAMSKPPISLDFTDPYGGITAPHFERLLKKYGAPIIILNLVKRREKRKKESQLWEEFVQSVGYLNQFLIDEHKIRYVAFDMARSNKKQESNVLSHLDDISEQCIKKTGFYTNNCAGRENQRQRGVIRTNCVDCLDRTNTAQFAVGKHALGLQLHALGVTPTTELSFDTDCMRMLESLYEDQGDTISLHYGGSNLVHRVQSYRKKGISSHSNDILQTLARYYKNSFSDADKQMGFNVFLGVYRPADEQIPLWALPNDYYLHTKDPPSHMNYCQWINVNIVECLPKSYNETHKKWQPVRRESPDSLLSDFQQVYRPTELTSFDNLFSFTMHNSIRSFIPKSVVIDSNLYATNPFENRRNSRWTNLLKNPLVLSEGTDEVGNSVFHIRQVTEDPDSSSSDESDIECKLTSDEEEEQELSPRPSPTIVSFNNLLDNSYTVYGVDSYHAPCRTSTKLYKHYEKFYEQVQRPPDDIPVSSYSPLVIECKSIFPLDSEFEVIPPQVKKETKSFYQQVIFVGRKGATTTSKANKKVYEQYVQQLRQ